MAKQGLQIGERIDAAELAGMNQAHVDVAHLGPLQGFVEQRILAMQDGPFQGSLAQVMPTAGLCRVLVAH
jgi:hypothetical protein